MKQLNTYIQEGLFNNIGVGLEHQIEEWLKINTETTNYFIIDNGGDKYIVNAESVKFHEQKTISLTNDLFEWGEVETFDCSNTKIKDLTGGPKTCLSFDCHACNKLKTLEGSPKKCDKFDCHFCENLTSLKGAPKKCDNFDCYACDKLKTLEGSPKECNRFDCSYNENLISLKGAPKICYKFICLNCPKLNSLKYAPLNVTWFDCRDCKIKFSDDEIHKHMINLF